MKLSTEQVERLSERVFKVLKNSGHVSFDYIGDEKIEDKCIDVIFNTFEEDMKSEDRLSKEAERLVQQQSHIAKASGKTIEELTEEVKVRLAKSKKVVLGDGPERSDMLAEKILKGLWKLDSLDFFTEDFKIQNCLARAIHRFRSEDDKFIDAVERIVSKKTEEEPYSPSWCLTYDKCQQEIRQRLATANS